MKLKLLLSICFLFLTLSGFCQRDSFTINGTTTDDYKGYIYLFYGEKIDSSLVENSKFFFKGAVDFPIASRLSVKNGSSSRELYLENSEMEINVSIKKSITYINSISGNKTAQLASDIMSYFEEIQADPKFSSKLYGRLDTIISQNPRNQFSGMLLSDIILDPVFSYEEAYSLFNKLDKTVQAKENIESIEASLDKLKNIKIGTLFNDFELPDSNGKIINTKDLKKTLLLVEFWASWCVPCRKTNPELVKIYNKYKTKGFEIYGVSLDSNKESWTKAIERDGLNWSNTLAKDGFKNEIIKQLGIQYIPSNFLINKKGEIIAINIKPQELEKVLIT